MAKAQAQAQSQAQSRPDRKALELLNAQKARGLSNRDEALNTVYDVLTILLDQPVEDKPPVPEAEPATKSAAAKSGS